MSELKIGTRVRVNHLKRIGYVKEICHDLKAEGVLYLVELDNSFSYLLYKEDLTVVDQPKESNMKTKEELEKVIAEATAALAELDKVTPWTPKDSRWLISPTKEVDDVGGFKFQPIVAESGLLRDNHGDALVASNELYTYSRLLAYRDEFGKTPLEGSYCVRVRDNSYGLEEQTYKRLGTVYFTEAVARQLISDLNSGRFIL